jgi:hypothetical protein
MAESWDVAPVRAGGASRLITPIARLRALARRRRVLITVLGSLATAAVLVFVLAGRRHEFSAALSSAAAWVLAVTVLLQIVALLSRSEAWHLTIQAAGGTVARRVLYRASSMQVLGSVINGQLGVAACIAALRHSSPEVSPQVPTLIAAEVPILSVEAALAVLASFTLVAPLGLPWWLPVIGLPVIALASAGLRHLALRRAASCGAVWRCSAAAAAAPSYSPSSWRPFSGRSSATGCCFTPSAWTPRSSTPSPC